MLTGTASASPVCFPAMTGSSLPVALTFIVQSVAALNPLARCNRSRNLGSQASDR